MLAVIPKVHFKESQNLRIRGSWMEVFIHVEPGRLGGNTRTFAGAPALNLGPLPPQNASVFRTWWRAGLRWQVLSPARQWSKADQGRAWNTQIAQGSMEQPASQTPAQGAQCRHSMTRLIPSLVKIITLVYSPGVGEANSFWGSGSLWNCFPNVWGLALWHTLCPWVFFP